MDVHAKRVVEAIRRRERDDLFAVGVITRDRWDWIGLIEGEIRNESEWEPDSPRTSDAHIASPPQAGWPTPRSASRSACATASRGRERIDGQVPDSLRTRSRRLAARDRRLCRSCIGAPAAATG
jgi:hypothetical protein